MYDQRNWFESVSNSKTDLVLMADLNGTAIGVCVMSKINWMDRSLSISGSIYRSFRKAQFVRPAFCAGLDFAFEMLNMHRVEAEVLEYNIPARQLEIDMLGFKVEGRRREAVWKCGKPYDSLVLGILRSEWEAQERVKAYGGTCNKTFDHAFCEKAIERYADKLSV